MSGHSKWATTKHKKAKVDSQRAVVFQKFSREIIVASRLGGGDLKANFRLRTAVEKAKLVMGANFWTNETLDGRVYEFVVSDGPVGLRQPTDRTAAFQVSYPSIAYPVTVVLSQTWNKELAALQGKALGNDCIEQNVDTLLGPGVNIKRNPLNL